MDIFMDKLAQRLTAQEIIKANTAADTEELNSLKEQLAAYNSCLEKLQKLIDDGADRLQNAQGGEAEIKRLVDESISKIQAIQENTINMEEPLRRLQEQLEGLLQNSDRDLDGKFDNTNDQIHKECVKVYRNVQAVVVEEGNRQKESMDELTDNVDSVKGKVKGILAVSILAMLFALVSAALQILSALNIWLF